MHFYLNIKNNKSFKFSYFSFSIIINIRSAAWLLNALSCVLFTIAASNMWKFIWICFSVHWIWKILAMTSLIHWRSRTIAAYSAHSSKSTYSANWSLLNTPGLGSNHCHSSVIHRTCHSYWRSPRSFIWTAVIYSIMWIMRMVGARRRLLHMKMIDISYWSTQTLSLVIILKWCWSICAYYITNIRNVWDTNLGSTTHSRTRRSICAYSCCYIHIILSTLIWAIWVIGMIRMCWWQNPIMIDSALCETRINSSSCYILLVVVATSSISFFSWLRTDSP